MFEELKKLLERQAKIVADARAALEEISDDTTEERATELNEQFDKAMADADALEPQIERLRKLIAAEGRLEDILAEGDPRRPSPNGEGSGEEERVDPEYAEVFDIAIRHGVSELSPEQRQVLMDAREELPAEIRAQATGTDSAGGYTVPEEFSGEIDRQMAAWGPMWDADIVRELNTSNGRRLPWPTINDTGNTGRIKAENASVDDDGTDDAVFGEIQLDAYVYDTGMVKVPIELLQDSAFDMEALLNDLFGERLGRLANSVLTTGTGSSQPNGIVTAAAAGTTAASATAVTGDELIDHLHTVDPAYRASPKARWMFNDTTLAAIRKLKDGDGNYLWQMGDVRTGEPAQLLGHPYSVNQAMVNMATTTRSILFGDFSRYVVRKVLGFQVLTLRERYAEAFQVGLVGFKRFDGELLNAQAVKALVQA